MHPFLAEFIGTFVLISFGCGVNAGVSLSKSYSNQAGWLTIAFGWGLGVTLAIFAAGNYSGAHLNPAVTIGLAVVGEFPLDLVAGYLLSQLFGAILGATMVWVHYLPHWKATQDPGTKLGVFSTSPAIPSRFGPLVSEISGTFILLFAIMFIGANNFTEGLNPLVIGALIVAIGLSQGGTTGYAINPARDLGPRIAHSILPIAGKGKSNWSYAYVPIIGPLIGGVWGTLAYMSIFQGEGMLYFGLCTTIVVLFIYLSIRENNK